jgi:DNA repair protein RecO (recombination protein O)
MGIIKTKGIIIAESNMGDFDKMLTMLTPGLGKISCAAKGARRQNSALLAGTQFLCFGEYILYKSGENYSINSCETIEMFYNVRIDLDKIKYAVHITKIIQDVTNENENSYKILQLYLNTLYMISETEKDMDFVLSIFKMKLLCILGFKPRIEGCTNCGQKEGLKYFSIKDNGVKCEECKDKGSIEISPSTYAALKFIVQAPSKKLFSFNLKDESLRELKLLSKVYFNEKLEKEYKLEELW